MPADRFAAALLMALALSEQCSQDRLSLFAKSLRGNVVALCKRLKTDEGHFVLKALNSQRWHEALFDWIRRYL